MKSIVKIGILVLILLAGCDGGYTKKQYINEFQTFIVKTEKEYLQYEPERFIESSLTFKRYAEKDFNRFKVELTEKELVTIDRLKGQYYSFAAKYAATQIKNKTNSFYRQLDVLIDELKK